MLEEGVGAEHGNEIQCDNVGAEAYVFTEISL